MERVGQHTIVREIARAEVLSIFEAKDDDGRAVRLRVVEDGLELGDVATTSFEADLERVASFRHPGIDRPIAWSADEPMHVSTLLVRGGSLEEVVAAAPSKRIAVDVAAGVGADVAEALDAAHAAGLIHAGLSLQSILLGMDGRARVTDFGLMRWLNDRSSTHAAVMRGSIESLAPEQLSAPESGGRHTHVFGLGLVLYRVLTGKHAFDAPSALGMSIRLSMGKPTPIASHDVEIPEALSALVMQMLATSPADRPAIDAVGRTLTKHAGAFRPALGSLAASVAREAPAEELAHEEGEDQASGAPDEAPAESTPARAPTPSAASDASSASRDASPPPRPPASPPGAEWDGTTSVAFDPPTEPELELPERRNDYPTYVELRAPEDRDDVLHPPASGGDTSVWPATDPPGFDVPKTVILEAPAARPSSASSAPRLQAVFPPPLEPDAPIEDAGPARPAWMGGAPEWAIWAAIALGAFALLVGTATLVILIAG